ncbi:MAG: hypothetical protein IKN86_06750 [Bacteroidaceae bacterium]|jgi:hypothetical protein|nr:hypothetical protein [Bacteroidaceae bacterium]
MKLISIGIIKDIPFLQIKSSFVRDIISGTEVGSKKSFVSFGKRGFNTAMP